MDFNIPEGLTKIVETDSDDGSALSPVLAYFGEEEGKHYWLVPDGLTEEQMDELEIYPSDLAELLKTAVEVAQAPRPEDEGDWEGVSLMIVTAENIVSGEVGYVCRKCNFLVGGSADGVPEQCPGCATNVGG